MGSPAGLPASFIIQFPGAMMAGMKVALFVVLLLVIIVAGIAILVKTVGRPEPPSAATVPPPPETASSSPFAPVADPGEHCGGNMRNASVCVTGYHCAPVPGTHLPFGDVGGICVQD